MSTNPYMRYAEWKQWSPDEFLRFSPLEDAYYAGELVDLPIAGTKVLEIGFGNGSFLGWARRRGAEIAGTEILPEAAERAREAGIDVFDSDLEDAAKRFPAHFDLIVAFDVFEHVTHDELLALFDKFAILLKSTGRVVARFPNGQSPLGRVHQYGDASHRSVLSGQTIMQILGGRPWILDRYDNVFRVNPGRGAAGRMAYRARYLLRDAIEKAACRIYGVDIPFDPNVSIRLRPAQSV